MDTQEAELRRILRNSGVNVIRDGDSINLIMPSNLTFSSGGHQLNADFFQALDSEIMVLNEY